MKLYSAFLILLFASTSIFAQAMEINRIDPPNWWKGMKNNEIQLMVYGKNLEKADVMFDTDFIRTKNVHYLDNTDYCFIDIEVIPKITPGEYKLILDKAGEVVSYPFSILERDTSANIHRGFSNEDVIYLVMADRFANGNPNNDLVEGYVDTMQNIPNQGRAGGDIQGLMDKLDYIKDFGATTIWPTPLLENNTFRSYHGYSITDHYNIDPRHGDNELYKKFVKEAHGKGLKVIVDHVSNHISENHIWMKSLPMKDWINGTMENHLSANHHKMVYTDPHADSSTIRHVHEGWFTDYMPDLNQSNKYLANYIIQNTIWWIEYAGLDGIREDTYPYSDQEFMSVWAKDVMEEYPSLNIVAEVWTGEPAFLAGYQGNSPLPKAYNSNSPAVTDFGLRDQLVSYLNGYGSLYKIYNVFAKDYLYADPDNLVTFVDNHDVGRAMYYADSDSDRLKIAYQILLTARGIPQIFYGSEIGMKFTEDHGTLRHPFPGGFEGDSINAFTEEGRSEIENDLFRYLQKLISLRKEYSVLQSGKMTQFPPENNLFVIVRSDKHDKIVSVVNGEPGEKEIVLSGYGDILKNCNKGINLFTGEEIDLNKPITIAGEKGIIIKIME